MVRACNKGHVRMSIGGARGAGINWITSLAGTKLGFYTTWKQRKSA